MVKRACVAGLLFAFAIFSVAYVAAASATLDPKMYGMWLLDTARSTFGGPYPPPTAGLVNWTEHGWVFAVNSSDGLYADATVLDHGCILVGVSSPYACEVKIVTPTHVHLVLREGQRIEREGDVTLVDDNTQRTIHRVTPKDGAPYTETTVWTRQR